MVLIKSDNETLISVVVPTHKRPRLLQRAIKSVFNQTYKNFELIVVVDGPDNLTIDTLKKVSDPRLIIIELPQNVGGSGARNAGITAARGEWIAFLDDDDEWLPNKLEKQVDLLYGLKDNIAMIGTGHLIRYKNKKVKVFMPELRGNILDKLLIHPRHGRAPAPSSVLCKKSILFQVGLFDNSFLSRQDTDLYIRIAKKYQVENVNDILVVVNEQSENRISDDINKRISGLETFYEKYYDEFLKRPKHHSIILRQHGNLLLRSGDIINARRLYRSSLKYNHLNMKSIILYISTLAKPLYSIAIKLL